MKEVWKSVIGFEGLYEISNFGKVKSTVILGKGIGKGCFRKGIELKPLISIKSNNYKGIRFSLSKDGKRYKIFSHILVAKAFPEICGEWFEGAEIHHKDFNPLNNCADNLVVLTKEEHILIHRNEGKNVGNKNPFFGKHHTIESIRKANKKKRKPIYQYSLEGICLCYWYSCTDCERETGFCKVSINQCCLGKKKTAHGYIWRYAKEGEN